MSQLLSSTIFDDDTIAAARRSAERLRVPVAALLACAEVESAGKIYAHVQGRPEPLIRFEGHYFDRRLKGAELARARAMGLASPKAGAVKNPKAQASRWRLLATAISVNRRAALESVSWGIGQVMGAHWQWLGYESIDGLVKAARSGAGGQIDLMARYIEKAGLADELRRQDFNAFARGYNGPNYRKYAYHTKMAAAFARLSGVAPISAAAGMLRLGSRGAKVRELQVLLGRAGYPVKVDDDFGPATRDAVKLLQAAFDLKVDGVAGPETFRILERYRQHVDERPGSVGPLDTVEARSGGGTALGGGGLVVAADQVNAVADKIGMTGVGWVDHVVTGIYVIGGLLMLGGVLWGAYGWLRAGQTDEGDIHVKMPA